MYFPKKETSFLIIYDSLDQFLVNLDFILHIFRRIMYDGCFGVHQDVNFCKIESNEYFVSKICQ
jgi:hypothetical protein